MPTRSLPINEAFERRDCLDAPMAMLKSVNMLEGVGGLGGSIDNSKVEA